jgi:hypothetical protein
VLSLLPCCPIDQKLTLRFAQFTQSNPDERARANTLAEGMATECTVVVIDQGSGDDAEFFELLSGDPGDIGQDNAASDEEVSEFIPVLFRLGEGEPALVAEGEPIKIGWAKASPKIDKAVLNESDVFLLDAGWEIFVWLGQQSDRTERLAAMSHIDAYGLREPRAKYLPSSIIKSGYESIRFQSFFFEQ